MFHRVKSEGQDQQPPIMRRQPEYRQDPVPGVAEFRTGQNNTPVSETRQDASSYASRTSEPAVEPPKAAQPYTKEPKTMSQQDSNNSQTDSSTPLSAEERDVSLSSYQRAGQAPVRTPVGAYPGTYTGYGVRQPEQPSPASSAATSSDRRLTIGAGITMSGEIESCDYLLVEGTVEAALKGASVLDIAESGVFYGTVEIGEANIAGRFEGDISVQGRLTISATGTVTGSISYKELEIEAGAVIDGRLTPLTAVASSGKKPSTAATSKGKLTSGKDQKGAETSQNQSGNTTSEGELFSKAAAAE